MAERVLVVDDKPGIREFIAAALENERIAVTTAGDGAEALTLLGKDSYHLMITDLKMPRVDGMTLFRKARELDPEMEVVILTAHGSVDSAVEAMKLGAFDYLAKPMKSPAELRIMVERALERRRLRANKHHMVDSRQDDAIVAEDPVMLEALALMGKVAATATTVLLLGESGTGKEVAARAIHRQSPRAENPFIAINCAAISEQLVESEMFGHEKGAFTGASECRRGRFELADGGTLFLDEVGELTPKLQAKLLRVIQERCFERVGGTRTIAVDVRLVTATNRDLLADVKSGLFREDLYHRLAVFPIRLPPLRNRPGDIPPLAKHLLAKVARQTGRSGLKLTPEAIAKLGTYSWPGNIRELGNVIERAAILAETDTIGPLLIHFGLGTEDPSPEEPVTLKESEIAAIRRALVATGGHRKNAADRLDISLRALYNKLKEYNLG